MLKIDLYQISMALSHIQNNTHNTQTTCESFFRKLPKNRNFLVLSGINKAIKIISNMEFTDDEINFLKSHPYFNNISDKTFKILRQFKFSGDILTAPEGTIVFPNVPFFQITGSILDNLLTETIFLSIVNHSTSISSKAIRLVKSAGKIPVVELGTRRTHPESAIDTSRASYIAGCLGTSNIEASFKFGIPSFGTMSHLQVMFYRNEEDSFKYYMSIYKDGTTILVDTYNIINGIKRACQIAKDSPKTLQAIRIDSELFDNNEPTGICRKARLLLNSLGFFHTKIVVSDDLNEYKIEKLIKAKEPIDIFGVGTELVTSKDAPALSGVYKLVDVDGRPVAKNSSGKVSLPGKHKIGRKYLHYGTKTFIDTVRMATEKLEKEESSLLVPGDSVLLESLESIRKRTIIELSSFKYNQVLNIGVIGISRHSRKLQELIGDFNDKKI